MGQRLAEPPAPDQHAPVVPPAEHHPMEIWISYVLRGGVTLSGIMVAIGLAWFLGHGPRPNDPHSMAQLLAGQYANRASPSAMITGLHNLSGTALVEAGLLVLILTPALRVGLTLVLFFLQKDWKYVCITAFVFVILLLGLTGTGV